MPRPAPNPAQQLTDRAREDLLGLVDRQITGGLTDAGNIATDFPGFVAGPSPQVTAFSPLYGITRAACRSWARGFGPQQLPGFDSAWSGICSPYLGTIGENPSPGLIAPPFTGGQCVIQYNVTASYIDAFDEPKTASTQFATGPIAGLRPRPPNQFGNVFVDLIRPDGSVATQILFATSVQNQNSGAITSAVPTFPDQVDSCGNPPTEYKPPTQAPNLPAVPTQPINFPGIGPVGVDVTFGPDGEIIIDFPGIDGTVTVPNPFAPDAGDDPGSGALAPGAQGTPGTPQDVAPGDAAEGENPSANLTGVLVQTIEYPPRVNRLFNPTESYTKGAYYVYLGGDAGLALIDTAAITRQDQFYPAPPGCNRFRVVPNAGFKIKVTPYFEG